MIPASDLRARFAVALSAMYGREVPAYTTLVEVATAVNADVVAREGAEAERLGTLHRVTAERHGAVRVGTVAELRDVARLFGGFGMHPVGFYDLRDAATPIPVVSTAFRPVDSIELARNPFRVFCSMLVVDDRRFFTADLEQRLSTALEARTLVPPDLVRLAVRAAEDGGLPEPEATTLVDGAVAVFELGTEPVDRAWYDELEAVSSVAADIGGVSSTHINHLTPRVLDIDDLYRRMAERGIEMIDRIQGPPRWAGPPVLLRQTSFRALAEPRLFRDASGATFSDRLRVRFGEVEARGVALTRRGREVYDTAMARVDGLSDEVAAREWAQHFPGTDQEMAERGLAYYLRTPDGLEPVVYEDFLPASAAGIFRSNLTSDGAVDTDAEGTSWSAESLSEALGMPIADPYDLYDAQVAAGSGDSGA
ncbi:2-oxoadipate dioxygenase/decarboxylase [Rhodococcus sp. NBC_00297]|uniref:2-oxoadipate dioxygenase/decarboxylase n=1 Tax=Rhodococcus sp. NBC_00297 TaxID=2976005 RepID=UPI002E2B3EF1|nr:VOC family protein [Rhodococcus sp. NBC_00297]